MSGEEADKTVGGFDTDDDVSINVSISKYLIHIDLAGNSLRSLIVLDKLEATELLKLLEKAIAQTDDPSYEEE